MLKKSSKSFRLEFYIPLIIGVSAQIVSGIQNISFGQALVVTLIFGLKLVGIVLGCYILLFLIWKSGYSIYQSIKKFEIKLFDRGEQLSYQDESGLYEFETYPGKGGRTIFLPCRKDKTSSYVFTPEEKSRISLRIKLYFFPVHFKVRMVEKVKTASELTEYCPRWGPVVDR